MIIISDCLTDHADEGTIKIASKIAKILKEKGNKIFQLNTSCSFADKSFNVGRTGISYKLLVELSNITGSILYIPNASMTQGICLKVLLLTVLTRKKVILLPVYRRKMTLFMKLCLKIARIELIVFSNESYRVYKNNIRNKIHYVQAGVDTKQFREVSNIQKDNLRAKYGIGKKETVVLHIGHMVEARNLRKLTQLDPKYHVILVISTSTRWDENLYEELSKQKNITIVHEYIPHVEEYYQLADVYFFPVEKIGCVDVPLSVLEAAACGTPIVTTKYGELKSFTESQGFAFVEDFSESNQLIERVKHINPNENRSKVLEYEWLTAVDKILKICGGK